MNLLYADIVATFEERGMRFGKMRVGAALRTVPLGLVADASGGDRVLLCDGVAIGKVRAPSKKDENHVPRDPR